MIRLFILLFMCLSCHASSSSCLGHGILFGSGQMMGCNTNGQAAPLLDLFSTINNGTMALQVGRTTNDNWNYTYNPPDLAGRHYIWDYPCQIACVGVDLYQTFQVVMLTSNIVISSEHISAWMASSAGFIFCDTNGTTHTVYPTNHYSENDFEIDFLGSPLPPSVVPPMIFPPGVTNYLASGDQVGLLAVYPHKNVEHVGLRYCFQTQPTADYHGGPSLNMMPASTNSFGQDGISTGGDSSSPMFCILNKQPVLIGTMSESGGYEVLENVTAHWAALTNHIDVSTMRVVDLSPYLVGGIGGGGGGGGK